MSDYAANPTYRTERTVQPCCYNARQPYPYMVLCEGAILRCPVRLFVQ